MFQQYLIFLVQNEIFRLLQNKLYFKLNIHLNFSNHTSSNSIISIERNLNRFELNISVISMFSKENSIVPLPFSLRGEQFLVKVLLKSVVFCCSYMIVGDYVCTDS